MGLGSAWIVPCKLVDPYKCVLHLECEQEWGNTLRSRKKLLPLMGWRWGAILTHLWAGPTHSYSAITALSAAGTIPATDAAESVIIEIPGSTEIIRGATSSWREFCFLFPFISIQFTKPQEAAGGGIRDCVLHLFSSCLGEHNGASEAPAIPQSIYHTRVQFELTVHHTHRNVKWSTFERTGKKDLDNTNWKWRSPTSSL